MHRPGPTQQMVKLWVGYDPMRAGLCRLKGWKIMAEVALVGSCCLAVEELKWRKMSTDLSYPSAKLTY